MLDLQLKRLNPPPFCLISYFQAVGPEAALGPLAGAVGGAVAGVVTLGSLNRANQLCFFHIG
jgi:hypothetical protein